MFIAGAPSLSTAEHSTAAKVEVASAIVVSDVEDELATHIPSLRAVRNVLAPLKTPSTPSSHQEPMTVREQATGVASNPTSLVVPVSTLEMDMELADDVLLSDAVANWSQAEIMMNWDLEWERYQGDTEWERRSEFGELPEELVYRPASAFHNPTVAMPTPKTPPITDVAPTTQEVSASFPSNARPS